MIHSRACRAELKPLGMPAVELALDERRDVDIIDDQVLNLSGEPGDVQVGDLRADDPDLSHVALAKGRAPEIGAAEPRPAKRGFELVCHRHIIAGVAVPNHVVSA